MKKQAIKIVLLISLCIYSLPLLAGEKLIGIANFGEVVPLMQVVEAFKKELKNQGIKARYEYIQVNFDSALIPQMLAKIGSSKPDLVLTITTPVAQASKQAYKNKEMPIVFAAVTDPVGANLVPSWHSGDPKMTGASDMQDMDGVMAFIGKLIPGVKRIGFPYNPGEANDVAQLKEVKKFGKKYGYEIVEVGVFNANDIIMRIQSIGMKIDALYIPASNLLQSALPAISSVANRLSIPVINGPPDGVSNDLVLATFSVDYEKVGVEAAKLASQIFQGVDPASLAPVRPAYKDHKPLISAKRLKALSMTLPASLANCNCVVD